jgi:hypothetical protein
MRVEVFVARRGLTGIAMIISLMLAAASTAGPAAAGVSRSVSRDSEAPAAPGSPLWLSRNCCGIAESVAASPAGGAVFVTGDAGGAGGFLVYNTVGLDATTGAQLWATRYNGPGSGYDFVSTVAVSPDGGMVFVTGSSTGLSPGLDYATVGYNAATGAQVWASRYNGPANGYDAANKLVVSPDGHTVFVTGSSRAGTADDYTTIAYDAGTGAQLWVSRYNGAASRGDVAYSLAVSPSGETVYVTGASEGARSRDDYATVAYDASTGARRWVSRYNGRANARDIATSVAVDPSGSTVYVTGLSRGASSGNDYATVAYNAATGARRWASRYNGTGNGSDIANSLAVDPAGHTVFVTGESTGAAGNTDYATAAYNAQTGAPRWVKRYQGPANSGDSGEKVTVGRGGRTAYVTGFSGGGDATIAYGAATGARRWIRHFPGAAASLAVGPTGDVVYVTGGVPVGNGSHSYFGTIAYRG